MNPSIQQGRATKIGALIWLWLAVAFLIGCFAYDRLTGNSEKRAFLGNWRSVDGNAGITFLPDGTVSQAVTRSSGRFVFAGKYFLTGAKGVRLELNNVDGSTIQSVYIYHFFGNALVLEGPDGNALTLNKVE